MRLIVAFVVAVMAISGCKGANPNAPSSINTASPKNEGNATITVTGPNGTQVSSDDPVEFGSTIMVSYTGSTCEQPSYFFGHRFVRDDGQINGPLSARSCAGLGTGSGSAISLIEQNNLWSWGRGHKIMIEILIMERYPQPIVYNRVVGELVFAR